MIVRTFGLTATALALLAAAPSFAEDAAPAKTELNEPAIVVTPVSTRELTDRVVTSGSIQPEEEVYVQPLVEGLSIKTLKADIGDRVKADDVLAVLSDDTLLLQKSQLLANRAKTQAARAQLEAQIIEAQSNADEANRQRDRALALSKSGTVSTAQADQASASATAAAARLNSAKQALVANDADLKVVDTQIDDINLKLARTEVKTPVGGLVSARNAKIGAIASGAGQPLFTIIRDSKLELKADLSEDDVMKVAPGQKVNISLVGGKSALTGVVKRVDPTVNATTRLGAVEITLDNPDGARQGMYAEAEIVVEQKSANALPVTAVTNDGKGASARVIKDGVVHVVPVETGIQDGEFIEITKGLKPGDKVVAKAGAYVRDGDHVKPVESLSSATN